MKKLFLISLFILVKQSFISCTADTLPEKTTTQTVNPDESGGQSGGLGTTTPKP